MRDLSEVFFWSVNRGDATYGRRY